MKIYRIGFKYDYMEKFRLMPAKYATKNEAENAAKVLISDKPFKTHVFELDTVTNEIKA